jgi:hypothetical protein
VHPRHCWHWPAICAVSRLGTYHATCTLQTLLVGSITRRATHAHGRDVRATRQHRRINSDGSSRLLRPRGCQPASARGLHLLAPINAGAHAVARGRVVTHANCPRARGVERAPDRRCVSPHHLCEQAGACGPPWSGEVVLADLCGCSVGGRGAALLEAASAVAWRRRARVRCINRLLSRPAGCLD